MLNAAFAGGGLSSVAGLGAYSKVREMIVFHYFSGASIGALIAICLAAGKEPEEIRDFLADNVEGFCQLIRGNFLIHSKVDEFLGNQLFCDLPTRCMVSITPLRKDFPNIITQANSGNLTCGKVAALSATLPGLFLPGIVKLDGKIALILDGGILFNPPLNPESENAIFTFKRNDKVSRLPWDVRQRQQEKKADLLFKVDTQYGTLGKRNDVYAVYEEGRAVNY